MDMEEASLLLHEAGVDFASDEVTDLVERTEGWAAGLYLAALAVNAGTPPTEAVFSFRGVDRYMGDYLHSEFPDRVSRAEVSFLTRTSILDRMCGPLATPLLNSGGSDRVLERLDSRDLLVVPLDHRRDWYRYHQLFRQLLQAELARRSRTRSRSCTFEPPLGTKGTVDSKPPSNMLRPPTTPTGLGGLYWIGANQCGPAAGSTPYSTG